jgi:hypothetical protein
MFLSARCAAVWPLLVVVLGLQACGGGGGGDGAPSNPPVTGPPSPPPTPAPSALSYSNSQSDSVNKVYLVYYVDGDGCRRSYVVES